MLCRRPYRTFLSRQTGKLVEVTGCGSYPVTERCVKPPVVVPHSVLGEHSKSEIIRDLPHSCKNVNSSDVYDSCKYDDSNIVDVRNVNEVSKVKRAYVNNHNNSDNEKLVRRRCYVCLCKESKHERFSIFGGCQSVYYCSKSCQLKGWKQHQVFCKAISQLVTERKEKLHKAGVYKSALVPSERDQMIQLIGENVLLIAR